ncbi:MAG: hypothetical protein RR139_02130 [Lachnospiraceae bacterium]
MKKWMLEIIIILVCFFIQVQNVKAEELSFKVSDEELNEISDEELNEISDEELNEISDEELNEISHEELNEISHEELNEISDEVSDKTQDIINQLDFSEIDNLLRQQEETTGLDFEDLVKHFINGEHIEKKQLAKDILDQIFHEVAGFRKELMQMVLLCVVFAILYHFANVFQNAAVTEISFYMVYMLLLVMLMKSFFILQNVVLSVMENMMMFLKALIPAFSMCMALSGQITTAAGFYEMTFVMIYVIEWVMCYFMVPAVQIYVVLELMNYLTEEEMLSRMTELIKSGVEWVMKFLFTLVIGINVVQNLLTPAIDSFKTNLVMKTARVIPGLGTSINAVTEIMVGSGIVIKNGVGVAGVFILLIMCAGPLIKVWVMTFLYKLLAAVIQPVADKRMTGCISGAGEGGRLLGKIVVTTTVMFLVSIAMVTAATTFH